MKITELKNMAKNDWLVNLIIYSAIGVIIMWAILKSIGVIKTPEWVSMIPLFAGAIAFGGLINKLDTIGKDTEKVKTDIKDIEKKLMKVEFKLDKK